MIRRAAAQFPNLCICPVSSPTQTCPALLAFRIRSYLGPDKQRVRQTTGVLALLTLLHSPDAPESLQTRLQDMMLLQLLLKQHPIKKLNAQQGAAASWHTLQRGLFRHAPSMCARYGLAGSIM